MIAIDAETGATWWDTVQSGGVVGYIIIGLSVLALALIIMHLVQIRRTALMPPAQLDELDQLDELRDRIEAKQRKKP